MNVIPIHHCLSHEVAQEEKAMFLTTKRWNLTLHGGSKSEGPLSWIISMMAMSPGVVCGFMTVANTIVCTSGTQACFAKKRPCDRSENAVNPKP